MPYLKVRIERGNLTHEVCQQRDKSIPLANLERVANQAQNGRVVEEKIGSQKASVAKIGLQNVIKNELKDQESYH